MVLPGAPHRALLGFAPRHDLRLVSRFSSSVCVRPVAIRHSASRELVISWDEPAVKPCFVHDHGSRELKNERKTTFDSSDGFNEITVYGS